MTDNSKNSGKREKQDKTIVNWRFDPFFFSFGTGILYYGVFGRCVRVA
jgi:hypothetical protein